ncbi:MAG: hypothetical protein A3J74_07220 [Elusimicrobia bacterium RIFCSPHIGHO2_02_FULL_57_9]|nr:MAG: hypothetical protein A3J74_07220 [Elusimicrobia bacterium RIFCSPHIGHO2_02_FULL_57_9]
MKYWLFHSNQVNGPYEPEELAAAPGYTSESLVCPEGQKGTKMGDWQRASAVPELSSLPAVTTKAAIASLPPDPTIKDLAAMGNLQEKISLLENAIAHLQDNLQKKDSEILNLHNEFQDKSRQSQQAQQEFALKIKELEEKERLIKEEMAAKIQDLEHQQTQQQSQAMQNLTLEIDALKAELKERKSEPPPAAPQPPSEPVEISLELAQEEPAAAPTPEQISAFPTEPAPGLAPLAEVQITPPPAPNPILSMPEVPMPAAPVPPVEFPVFGAETLLAETSVEPKLSSALFSEPTPAPARSKPQSKVGKYLFLSLGLLTAGGVSAFMLGLWPGNYSSSLKIPGADTPLSPPVPELNPAAPSPHANVDMPQAQNPEDKDEDLKQSAIELVKNFASADKAKSIAQVLEKDLSKSDGINPWVADKAAEDIFKVNFYSPNSDGQSQPFEFEANMANKKVTPVNEAARVVMQGKQRLPKPSLSKQAKQSRKLVKKKAKIRPKKATATVALERQAPKEKDVDEMLLPGFTQKPAELAPAAEESKTEEAPAPQPKKGADADLLDNLLKP